MLARCLGMKEQIEGEFGLPDQHGQAIDRPVPQRTCRGKQIGFKWQIDHIENQRIGSRYRQRLEHGDRHPLLPGHAEREGGVGLGLSLVRQIVQAHGGQVACQAREGGGSCFVIHLPPSAALRPSPKPG